MNESAPLLKPRHTLQVVRIPSSEVQNLGFTSFYSWLNSLGYDTTNHSNQRADWARDGGWHLKACKNKVSNQEDFWLISFDGKGGVLLSEKSQQDYRSAYRRLIAEGYSSSRIEAMTRGELYTTYNTVRESGLVKAHVFDLTSARGSTGVLFLTRQHSEGIAPYLIQVYQGSIEKRLGYPIAKEHECLFQNSKRTHIKAGFTSFTDARDYLVDFIETVTGLKVKAPQVEYCPVDSITRIKPSQVDQADFELHPDQIRDMVNSSMSKTYNTYSRFGQARFRNAVLLNSLNMCAVTGVEYRAALDAAHIHPHSNGGAMKVANGIALRKDLHAVFDRGDMAINPVSLTVHFSKRARDSYLAYEKQQIRVIQALDETALIARWNTFCANAK